MATTPADRHTFDYPAVYQIQVEGRIDPASCAILAGMAGSIYQAGERVFVTTLVGELADQAALAGVLRQLYNMQFTVLSVIRLADSLSRL